MSDECEMIYFSTDWSDQTEAAIAARQVVVMQPLLSVSPVNILDLPLLCSQPSSFLTISLMLLAAVALGKDCQTLLLGSELNRDQHDLAVEDKAEYWDCQVGLREFHVVNV